jgi:hypothetical protein
MVIYKNSPNPDFEAKRQVKVGFLGQNQIHHKKAVR